jgi:hypothetical protein
MPSATGGPCTRPWPRSSPRLLISLRRASGRTRPVGSAWQAQRTSPSDLGGIADYSFRACLRRSFAPDWPSAPPRIPLPHGRGRSPRACHRPKAIPRRGEASIRLAGPPRAAAPCWRPSRGNRRARRAGAGWPVGRWATMPTTSPTGPGRTLPRASRVPHQTALGPPRPPGQGRRNPERTVRYGDRSLCTASVEPACAPPVESPEPQDRPTGFQVGRARVWRPEQK